MKAMGFVGSISLCFHSVVSQKVAVIHYPAAGSRRPFHWPAHGETDGSLSTAQVGQSVMHMSGGPAVSSVAARTLPVPDLFSPPAGNVLVGLDTEDLALLPRLRARMDQSQDGHQAPRPVTVDRDQRLHGGLAAAVAARVHAGQQALLGNGGGGGGMKTSDSGAGGLTACVSGVAAVRDSPLCGKTSARTVDTAVVAAGVEEKQAVEALKSRCGAHGQTPLGAVVTGGSRKQPVALEVSTPSDAPAAAIPTSTASSKMPSVVFSMEDPVERAFLLELERVSRVPSELGPAVSEASRTRLQSPAERLEPPPMVVITLGSLSAAAWEGKEGGEEKRRVAHDLADRVLDKALSELAVPPEKGLGAGLVAHVLFDGRGQPAASNDGFTSRKKSTAAGHAPGRRGKLLETQGIRLLAESDDAPSPMPTTATAGANYDLVEIRNYQICLWTAIALVLALLGAICCMVNMDVRPDSLLYAKFQTDVSSKLE